MEKGNFRKIELDITAVKKREEEAEEIEKLKQEAVKRLELFGFSTGFLDELKKDFKIKVADLIDSRDMTKFEERILEKVFSAFPSYCYFPYYIVDDWIGEEYYFYIFYIHTLEEFEFYRCLIKSADCVRILKCNITDPENITIEQDVLTTMERLEDALSCSLPFKSDEEVKEIQEKVDKLFEEQRRHKEYFYTRVYRSALTGEIIKTEPIIPDKYEP